MNLETKIDQKINCEVVLQTKRLTKQYGPRLVVDELNLEVRRCDIFGFLGPNGAGKTTTIRMILGLVAPTSGVVRILGKNVVMYPDKTLPHVGALIETPALYPYLSAYDNLCVVTLALGRGVPKKDLNVLLGLVGLAERQKDLVKTYSLGMKQRLGIAIALLQNPKLLILDEPTNGLDPAGIVEIRDLILRLSNEDITIFISSHLLTEIQQICTRVAIIDQGRLVTEASVSELTEAQGEFCIKVRYPDEALELIKKQLWGQKAYLLEGQTLITKSPDGSGSTLNLFLVQAGFVPETLQPYTQDLEQIFLRLTTKGSKIAQ
jgi:ABC-2 type transport system ATP-binding protein